MNLSGYKSHLQTNLNPLFFATFLHKRILVLCGTMPVRRLPGWTGSLDDSAQREEFHLDILDPESLMRQLLGYPAVTNLMRTHGRITGR